MLDLPTAAVDTIPQRDVNAEIVKLLRQVQPSTLYIPFCGDIHRDHELFAQAALVASRPPEACAPRSIYAYETLSETNWNAPYLTPVFQPNVFVDITEYLDDKLAAMRLVASQLKSFPHERSLEAIEALARHRGATVHRHAAEASRSRTSNRLTPAAAEVENRRSSSRGALMCRAFAIAYSELPVLVAGDLPDEARVLNYFAYWRRVKQSAVEIGRKSAIINCQQIRNRWFSVAGAHPRH